MPDQEWQLRYEVVGRITPAGTITEFSLGNSDADPQGIVAGPGGALWFTEENGNAIGRITTLGGITLYPIPTPFVLGGEGAGRVAAVGDGRSSPDLRAPATPEAILKAVEGLRKRSAA